MNVFAGLQTNRVPPLLFKKLSYATGVPSSLYHVTSNHDVTKSLSSAVGDVLNIVFLDTESDIELMEKVSKYFCPK